MFIEIGTVERLKEHLAKFNVKKLEKIFKDFSYEKNIEPSVSFLKALNLSSEDFSEILRNNPDCFITRPEDNGKNNLYRLFEGLQEKLGYSESKYKKLIITAPKITTITQDELFRRKEFLREQFQINEVIKRVLGI